MIKRKLFTLFLLAIVSKGLAQDPAAARFSELITEDGLRDKLSILASDAMEGRGTGTRGQKMAAAFIRHHFEELGLVGPVNGSYYQPVSLYTSKLKSVSVKVGGKTYNSFPDVLYYGNAPTNGAETIPVVFAGKGTNEQIDLLNVEGKGVVVFMDNIDNFAAPLAKLREKKAKTVFVYAESSSEFENLKTQIRNFTSGGSLSVNPPGQNSRAGVCFITPQIASAIFNTKAEKLKSAALAESKPKDIQKIKPASINYEVLFDISTLKTENVLGYLEGTDKKDELIVVTSHYDHIGMNPDGEGDRINNGADDDGSGTVSVMEIASAFAQAKKEGKGPRRSILFMTVTGEEKGLLGSDYYTMHPVFPLSSTIVNLNIDMVGRRDPQHKDSDPYVYVIGSDKLSTDLHNLSESVNSSTTKLIFDYTYNDQNHPDRLYYRSDHWNFAKNNIPIIFYFDGIHEDYHKPSDEVDKIEFDLLRRRAQLVFNTAWEIANREQTIKPDQSKQ